MYYGVTCKTKESKTAKRNSISWSWDYLSLYHTVYETCNMVESQPIPPLWLRVTAISEVYWLHTHNDIFDILYK